MSLEYNKISKGLQPNEKIYVIKRDEVSEYYVRKSSNNIFYVRIYLKNGNSIYGRVEKEEIEFLINKLQEAFINKLYIKEYKNTKEHSCDISFIKLLDMYSNSNKLIDFIL